MANFVRYANVENKISFDMKDWLSWGEDIDDFVFWDEKEKVSEK